MMKLSKRKQSFYKKLILWTFMIVSYTMVLKFTTQRFYGCTTKLKERERDALRLGNIVREIETTDIMDEQFTTGEEINTDLKDVQHENKQKTSSDTKKFQENKKPVITQKKAKVLSKNTQNRKQKILSEINAKSVSKYSRVPEIPTELKPVLSKLLRRSFDTESMEPCRHGYFRVAGMDDCRPWLGCKEMKDDNIIIKMKKIGGGIGKLVYAGLLDGEYDIAIVENRQREWLSERVMEGNRNLLMLQPSPYVIQVIGYCEEAPNSTIITESCRRCTDFGKFRKRNKNTFNSKKISDRQRFEWATKIVGGFDYLHHGVGLPRVHCDLHTAEEALTQYLIGVEGTLFMGDVDEIPQVDKENGIFATCMEETKGIMKTPDFIAPEQRYTVEEYQRKKARKPVDEKSDIWKIPDLTKILMEGSKVEDILMKNLENIHQKCKNTDPKMRPTARKVLIEYLEVLKDFPK